MYSFWLFSIEVFYVLDTDDGTFSKEASIDAVNGKARHFTSATAVDGCVYMAPSGQPGVGVYDTTNREFDTIDVHSPTSRAASVGYTGVIALPGHLVLVPWFNNRGIGVLTRRSK